MLILTRKLGESIAIGDDIKIHLLELKGKQIRIGIEAPPHVAVHREEIYRLIQDQNLRAMELTESEDRNLREVWDKLRGLIASD